MGTHCKQGKNGEVGTKAVRYFWLDVLRILLCIGVVIYHYTPVRPSSGPMCVDGFFVLSGYLLANAFSRMEEQGGMNVCAFYNGKMRRLLPTLVASLMLGLFFTWLTRFLPTPIVPVKLQWYGSDFRMENLLMHYNVPAWYMVSELSFLILAPFLFFVYRGGKWAMLALCIITAAYAGILFTGVQYRSIFAEGLYFAPQARFWQFVAGMAAYMFTSCVHPRKGLVFFTWTLFGVAMALLGYLAVVKQESGLHFLNYTYGFDVAIVALFFLLIPLLAKLSAPESARTRAWFSYGAALTYPLYLYHVIVYKWMVVKVWELTETTIGSLCQAGLAFVVSVALSALSLRYLDPLFSANRKRITVAHR